MSTAHKKPANTASNAADAETSTFAEASTDAKTMADKSAGRQKKTEARSDKKIGQEPVVSDTIMETTERIEVIEEASLKNEDPLVDFKEKMEKEEYASPHASPQKNFMWPILFVVFLALLSMIGIFIYKNSRNINEEKINVVTLSPTPTVVTEPTKVIDLSKYEIKILNGSGVDGEAGRQKGNLETEGFTVASVGNADNSDYTDTVIQAKKEVDKEFLDKLKSVLATSFTMGETETLTVDSSTPVIVIIGTKN
ncbi:MAG: LytR C-terminal domain-containing protein [Candidatus Levybacteria bacterium]|nr:LytR C-terminal domain-containing protein [Candidatus Levybacteria bacterium]